MNRSQLLAVLGVGAFVLGIAALAVPGLLVLGVERYAVVGIGLLALWQTLRIVQSRRHERIVRTATGDPELPREVSQPGEDLDAVLDRFDQSLYRAGSRRREQLRSVAIEALTRYREYSPAEAREAVIRGTWTDDPYAAAFVGGDDVPRPPVPERIRVRLSGESAYWRGVRRTVAAITEVAQVEPGSTAAENDDRLRDRFGRRLHGSPGVLERSLDIDDQGDFAERLTEHWRGITGVALAGIGVGVLAERPSVILAGVVGIGYAAYARSSSPPALDLSIERSCSPERPEPDETVTVTLTVTNEGERTLPDLRIVDGVPPALNVIEGSPRAGTTLRPGGSVAIEYTVVARRGVHQFDPVQVVARNFPGTVEREQRVSAEGKAAIECLPPLRPVGTPVPLREQPTQLTGRVETSTGGAGTEFFATRDYRPGDPMNRIDWNRQARTGDLATLEFREERSATVVLLVDATSTAAVGPHPRGADSVERSVEAATQVFTTVLDAGNRVGIAALGDIDCWLEPGAGEVHRTRGRELLATGSAFVDHGHDRTALPYRRLSRLRRRIPGNAQIVLFSPLTSAAVAHIARQFDADGHPVTVVSPDPTTDRTSANELATLTRQFRISDLRRAGIPVVDWPWDDDLAVAVARSTRRWSR